MAPDLFAGVVSPRVSANSHPQLERLALDTRGEILRLGPVLVTCTEAQTTIDPEGVSCVLAGRLYNSDELALTLGMAPETPPEQVLRTGYDRWRWDLLARLRGAFQVVVWDADREEGLIAHDQLGDRGLFTRQRGSGLVFGGEVSTVLSLLSERPGPDPVAVSNWLAQRTVPLGRTMYEGVQRVGNGRAVDLPRGSPPRQRTYWAPTYQPDGAGDPEAQMRRAASEAVRRRLTGQHASVMLSGGLDSALVAALAREHTTDLKSYSAVFPDRPGMDESALIGSLCDRLGIPSTTFAMRPQGAFAKSLEYLDRWQIPLSGPGFMFEEPLAQCAAEHGATILLDGQGGDEVFGGSFFHIADLLGRVRLLQVGARLRDLPGAQHASRRQLLGVLREYGLRGIAPHTLHRIARRLGRPAGQSPPWMRPAGARRYWSTHDPWSWKLGGEGPRWWRHTTHVLVALPELGARNDYVRHRAAAAGLIGAPPLLDVDLIETALRIRPESMHQRGIKRSTQRGILKGMVPEELRLNQTKSNFAAFYHESLSGADLPAIRQLLTSPRAEIGAHVDMSIVRDTLLDSPPSVGSEGWMGWAPQVWALATTEAFLQLQIDGDAPLSFLRQSHPPQPAW